MFVNRMLLELRGQPPPGSGRQQFNQCADRTGSRL